MKVRGRMWYVAQLMFAMPPNEGKRRVKCESCRVLFDAPSALMCYDKALSWAQDHARETLFELVGVQHITPLDDEPPKDGSEIGGSFFDAFDVWQKVDTLIPDKHLIPVVRWEANSNTPIGELMTEKQQKDIREIFGQ